MRTVPPGRLLAYELRYIANVDARYLLIALSSLLLSPEQRFDTEPHPAWHASQAEWAGAAGASSIYIVSLLIPCHGASTGRGRLLVITIDDAAADGHTNQINPDARGWL